MQNEVAETLLQLLSIELSLRIYAVTAVVVVLVGIGLYFIFQSNEKLLIERRDLLPASLLAASANLSVWSMLVLGQYIGNSAWGAFLFTALMQSPLAWLFAFLLKKKRMYRETVLVRGTAKSFSEIDRIISAIEEDYNGVARITAKYDYDRQVWDYKFRKYPE